MRLVRLGDQTSQVGADVRSSFASWGAGDVVTGGIALLGITPMDCPRPVEAIVLMPRGLIVVAGVDLPDPAMRLDAPLNAAWKTDGWPLVRPDRAVNPAGEALATTAAITGLLERARVEPIPVSTVIAVGPYVSQVVQATADLHRGVRVLHPRPTSLLAATRELATYAHPCSVDAARALLTVLVGVDPALTTAELTDEGFVDAVTPAVATANTMVIPRVRAGTADAGQPAARPSYARWLSRWFPLGAVVLLTLLLVGIIVAIASAGGAASNRAASNRAASSSQAADVTAGGMRFTSRGSAAGKDCATAAYGDIQVWLSQHQCVSMARALYQTTTGGQQAAIALAQLVFADAGTAKAFSTTASTVGTGGVTDLVKAGHGWPGGPQSFDNAAYAVTVAGASVRIVEVVWVGKTSTPTDPALRAIADAAAGLPALP